MARGDDNSSASTRPEVIAPTAFRPPGALSGHAWPRLPWRRLSMLAALALGVGTIYFVFGARSVEILTVPATAELTLDGGFAPRLGTRWMLLPGRHRIGVRARGYHPLQETLEIGSAPQQRLTLTLRPLPGLLRVEVTPALPAAVDIDDRRAGVAPGPIANVEAGTRHVRVTAPRYLDFETTLAVIGKGETQTLPVTLAPAWAEFSLASRPAGAQLRVDDAELGTTPFAGELLQGTREITVVKQGYKPWFRRIEVVAGQAVQIPDARLAKDDGYVNVVTTPAGAAVTVDGTFKGESPVRFAVTPDTAHEVAVLLTGYAPGRVRVTVASGANRELPLVLTPELAVIEFTTTPPDAELLLDGTPRGSATQRLELPTREHQVIVRRAGYASYRTLITPRKGIDKHLKIRLKTAAEMAREPAAQTNAASSATAQAAAAPTAAAPRTLPSGVPPAAAPTQRSAEAERQADLVSSILTPPELAGAAPVEFAADGRVRSILGQELMLVRGGEFRPAGGRDSVRLARPFYLALREVSNGEYRRFVTSHITRGPAGQDLDAATLPVANLTWEAAATYCNWLSRRESLPPFYQISFGRVLGINPEAVGYRLPTEAEWEFAARITPARDELEFPWSGRYPPRGRVGNFADENARALVAEVISGFDDGFAAAAPVGSYPPNLRGFHDLAGNVSEWVHDFHAPHSATGADPLGPLSGKSHVVRGSSWAQAAPAALRLDARTAGMGARPDLGFRLARYAR